MKCPLCEIEAQIIKSAYVIKDGKLFRKMVYSCRNKECSNFEKEIHKEYVELPVKEE